MMVPAHLGRYFLWLFCCIPDIAAKAFLILFLLLLNAQFATIGSYCKL
jgi:hypothetical protein